MSKIDKVSLYVYKQLNNDKLFKMVLGLLILYAIAAFICATVFYKTNIGTIVLVIVYALAISMMVVLGLNIHGQNIYLK